MRTDGRPSWSPVGCLVVAADVHCLVINYQKTVKIGLNSNSALRGKSQHETGRFYNNNYPGG